MDQALSLHERRTYGGGAADLIELGTAVAIGVTRSGALSRCAAPSFMTEEGVVVEIVLPGDTTMRLVKQPGRPNRAPRFVVRTRRGSFLCLVNQLRMLKR